jgi:DNA-binding LacI/PurR family transcriptional regulator
VLKVTLRHVAAEAGVSYQTVSKVLNGTGAVSAETETRIWEIVNELGYQPNIAARNLRKQTSNLIGFTWMPNHDGTINPILDHFLYSIINNFHSNGYHVLTLIEEPEREMTHDYLQIYRRTQVQGYVVASTNYDDYRIARMIQHHIPFVSFGRANDSWDFHWVDIDGAHGIELVMDHLLAKGHQRIALFTWPCGSRTGAERERGFFQKMEAAGLPIDSEWIFRIINTVEAGYHAAGQLLELPAEKRPSAIVCLADIMAIGAMNRVTLAGLEINRDMAITGFDDTPMSEFLHPPLTTVRQPVELAGQWVVDLVLAQFAGKPAIEKHVLLKPELVIRGSA